jgi:hypothetical protein
MASPSKSDLLLSLLNFEAKAQPANEPRIETTIISGHCIVMHGCTVTIHHTQTPAAETGV